MTTADTLAVVGRALYGERWQTQLAEALGVDDRTVRRWIAGDREPRDGVWRDLLTLASRRTAEIGDARRLIKSRISG